jgi:hypothetical protein
MKCSDGNCNREVEDLRYKQCTLCRNRKRRYRETHREEARAATKRWVEENSEYWREYQRIYRSEHKEEPHIYYIQNRDKIRARQKVYESEPEHREEKRRRDKSWYQNNKERHHEMGKLWREAHPEEWKAIKMARRARELNAIGTYSADEIEGLARRQENKCYYCGDLFFNGSLNCYKHREHKTPLSRGGSNYISNIVLSCPKCNLEKGTMTHEEFLQLRNV